MTGRLKKGAAVCAEVPEGMKYFTVAAIEKTTAPDGGAGANWYRYVIDSDRSSVTGFTAGSLKEVKAHAERVADGLNARQRGAVVGWRAKKG